MSFEFKFRTDTDLSAGLEKLIETLELRLELKEPIKMYIAGGMAAHLYTGKRVTTDVDAEFSRRIFIPSDILVETNNGQLLYIDTNYNSTFALMHENYIEDSVRVPIKSTMFEVFVLSPVDLVVSKIARLSDHDKEDIEDVALAGLVSALEIQNRAEFALSGFVGNLRALRLNLKEAIDIVDRAAKKKGAV